MIPCMLLIAFVCFMEIFNGILSPGKHPDFNTSIVAVMVFSITETVLPFWLLVLAVEGTGPSLKLSPVLLLVELPVPVAALTVLSTSLGTGLLGFALDSASPY
jgi:hypothetical protein